MDIFHLLSVKKGTTTIDFETAVEAYIELKKQAHYKEEALELLADEIFHSIIIPPEDKGLLEEILRNVSQTKQYGDTEAINEIWNILIKYKGFRTQWAEVCADILLRKRNL